MMLLPKIWKCSRVCPTLMITALWRKAEQQLTSAEQDEMQQLLERQSSDSLQQEESERLAALMDEYGRLLVQKP